MGGRSAPWRYAGLFNEHLAGKAAKRGLSAPKLLFREEQPHFAVGTTSSPSLHPFASLRGQGGTPAGQSAVLGRGAGGPSAFPGPVRHFVQETLENGFDSFTSCALLEGAVPRAACSPGARRTFASDQTAASSEGTGLWEGRKCEACHNEIFEDWKFKEGYKTIKQLWCEGSRV